MSSTPFRIPLIILPLFLAAACSPDEGEPPPFRSYEVAHYLAPCQGELGPALCQLVRDTETDQWQLLSEPIDDFQFEWGYTQNIFARQSEDGGLMLLGTYVRVRIPTTERFRMIVGSEWIHSLGDGLALVTKPLECANPWVCDDIRARVLTEPRVELLFHYGQGEEPALVVEGIPALASRPDPGPDDV